jgi:hypothetical protein
MENENEKKVLRKQRVNENNKKYYQENKDRLLEAAREKVECDLCGRSVTKYRLHDHQCTDLCIKRQNQIINREKRRGNVNLLNIL